ncbi:MAG: outer membrane lipoprotein-sorting protein [Bacteroidales bacterium]|nr:outer membrane lipoprotein-sorting protein [Bacteroidales bacterium]
MKNLRITSVLIILTMIGGFNVSAQLTGKQIIEKVYNRPSGNDQSSNLTMTLINAQGKQRVRKLAQYLKDNGTVEKKIMFFTAPADVKGTSFMNWSYSNGKSDDQWIYLPALKKIKRISSDSKGDYFMGSDFTYDDLGDRHPSQDTHKLLREETVSGVKCYVVQSIPKDEDYMYSKTITWINKVTFIGVKKEFYDEDGDLLKIMHVNSSQKISGINVITKITMQNKQKNHKTIMSLSNVKINTGISDSKFSERMMMRGI